ncbi:protein dehydratase [Roseovarius sp. A46]|uniref:FAS1-like dehydratase domain-containing protein n=1 Tax=Roseovarius sp. A46 TaxID=2109331 RepID=UPI0010113DA8|nr:MaoC family dehydratase N-terminal domain-containing protein [Roseovarius sp. A46]RXV59142.1 protein dehydratase [Roseovarius sp. A46]
MAETDPHDWIGREFMSEDTMTERLVDSFRATMAPYLAPIVAGEAPLGSHWCLFPTREPMAGLGADGHPAQYPYLPPPPLPRRMWGGGELDLIAPLQVGDRVTRKTVISDVKQKTGRSGDLWFLTLEHDYETKRGPAIHERQDVVYRDPVSVKPQPSAKTGPGAERSDLPALWEVETSPTLLFRYSAIIFVSHRIHYDLPYATEVEGYDGLVVHGPLQATLLLNAVAERRGRARGRFSYRGVAPAICGDTLSVCVDPSGEGDFHTRSARGIHMTGSAEG